MRPSQAIATLVSVIKHNEEVGLRNGPAIDYIRVGLLGEPGVGKSSIIGQAAELAGYKSQTFLASMRDPTDLSGGMVESGKYCDFLRPRFLPEGDEKIVFNMDEMGQASMPMQNACANLHLDRRAGTHDLGRFTTVIACWNPPKSRAGSTRLPSQYLNRLLQIELKPSKEDFTEHAQVVGADPLIPYFIDWKGEAALHDFRADRDVNATPRSWMAVNQTLKLGLPAIVEAEAIAGQVGMDHAAEFNAFRKLKSEITNIRDIFADPVKATVSEKRELQYMTLMVLQSMTTRQNVQNAVTYASRMTKELEVFFVRGLLRRDVAAKKIGGKVEGFEQTETYRKWLESGNVRFL